MIDLLDEQRVENTAPVHRRASTGANWASLDGSSKHEKKSDGKDYRSFRRASLSSQHEAEQESYRKTPTGLDRQNIGADVADMLSGDDKLADLMAKLQSDLQDIEKRASATIGSLEKDTAAAVAQK